MVVRSFMPRFHKSSNIRPLAVWESWIFRWLMRRNCIWWPPVTTVRDSPEVGIITVEVDGLISALPTRSPVFFSMARATAFVSTSPATVYKPPSNTNNFTRKYHTIECLIYRRARPYWKEIRTREDWSIRQICNGRAYLVWSTHVRNYALISNIVN